ncbi:putative L-galactonate transporter [Pantoea ananatis]|uniref:MFS transporter n=1 Tax=Pantoea ananas TaxID=553 RepID=UPI000B7E39B1|nr:MFS transporter [Pantoea ananatis]MCW0315098.1 putative L-galactonate transporter [Pantoea ananatis]MCW0333333.1 putative L-galactonate transporter [Pantoea ananatis]MCW0381417.1 putative L-galactonate transporter [Pantoea ananatis]MCW0406082.1 putative L-galactonate transporter [Pantoea ananatis]MCW0426256.1 putative L-galactonate transporter [Pantoea ananatis]
MKPSAAMSETTVSGQGTLKGKLRWGIVTLLLLAAIVNYLDRANLSIANTTIAAEFGFSQTEMGLLLSAFLWPYALANLPAGWLVDKLGPKKMFSWALGLWSGFTVLTAFANSYSYFYGLRMLLGVSESPFFTSGIKITHRWFGDSERGLPTAIINTGSQIANAIAPPILTVLLLTLGWRGMFVAIGVMGLPLLLAWWKFYRDPNAREDALLHAGQPSVAVPQEKGEVRWRALFRHSTTWFMVIGNFSIMFTIWVYLTWLPGYLEKSLGFSLKATGWIASIPFLAGILGVLVGGMLSDNLVRRGVRAITARKVPIVSGAALAACFVAPIPFVNSTPLAIGLLALGYFFSQMPQGALWTLASDIAPKSQVASLGAIQNFGGFLGAAMAPIVTGIILDTTGKFTNVFLLGAGLLMLGALSYGLFVRKPLQAS